MYICMCITEYVSVGVCLGGEGGRRGETRSILAMGHGWRHQLQQLRQPTKLFLSSPPYLPHSLLSSLLALSFTLVIIYFTIDLEA